MVKRRPWRPARVGPSLDSVRKECRSRDAPLRDWQSADAAVAGPAVAQMAEIMGQSKRFHEAAVCYQRLGRDFADMVCRDGKTGRQLVAALPPGGDIQQLMNVETVWPSGRVEVASKPLSGAINSEQCADLACLSESGPFFSGMPIDLLWDDTVRGYDHLGQEAWRATLRGDNDLYGNGGSDDVLNFNNRHNVFAVEGPLLFVQAGLKLVAVDPAKSGVVNHQPQWVHKGRAKIPSRRLEVASAMPLWVRHLNDRSPESAENATVGSSIATQPALLQLLSGGQRGGRSANLAAADSHRPRQRPLCVLPTTPQSCGARSAQRPDVVGAAGYSAGKREVRRRAVRFRGTATRCVGRRSGGRERSIRRRQFRGQVFTAR